MSIKWCYTQDGWSPHSGAGTGKLGWWLALYEDGRQVDYLKRNGRGVRHFSYQGAHKRARELNASLGIDGPEVPS